MPFIDGAAGRIYYRHWSTPEPPTTSLVFLHGFGEHSGLYHRYASELRPHGVDLWALDQYGHGLSDGQRGRLDSLDEAVDAARRLTALVSQTSPGASILLGGHSLGSTVALLTALDDPAPYRGIVLTGAAISPLPWPEPGAEALTELSLDALSSDTFYRDELANDPLAFTEGDLADIVGRLFPAAWQRFDDELESLRLPVLAIHGRDDAVAPIDGVLAWRSRLPNLIVEPIDNAAHDVLNEVAHTRVADLVGEFATNVAGAGAAA